MRRCPASGPRRPIAPAEIDGYLALAAAQPTAARRMRAAALVCLGAGAGLIRADLRQVRGTDIFARSGGVIVQVRGRRPRAVPVLARYHQPLLAGGGVRRRAAWSPAAPTPHAGTSPTRWPRAGRRDRAAPAGHQPAARHLAGRRRAADRPGHVHARRRDHLQPAARRHHRRPAARRRGTGGGAARRQRAVSRARSPVIEDIIDGSGIRRGIEALLPAGVRRRQLSVRTLLLGMQLTLADGRPAHLTRVHAALTSAARRRPGPARRHRGLEDRPAPAHLPAGRAHLQPRRRSAGQGAS